jgi:RimJ/RimL family protein N-acetyltransferase
MRFVGDGSPWSEERARAVGRALHEYWRRHGFGWRSVVERDSGRFVGFVGVAHVGENLAGLDEDELELGCWIDPAFWRHGFAAQASQAVLDETFARPGTRSVIVVIRAGHDASLRGAQKLGFAFERRVEWQPGVDALVARLSRPTMSATAKR